jgi:hypothetical protein
LKDKFRLTGSYQLLLQDNTNGAEHIPSHKLSIESVWRRSVKSDIRAQVSLVQIDYKSLGNIPIDFAILQGLQNDRICSGLFNSIQG